LRVGRDQFLNYLNHEESMATFENKLVAVLNKSIPSGNLMNAVAHLCIGFGAKIGQGPLRLTNYKDADGGDHPNISEIPFIVLEANSNKIRALRQASIEQGIEFSDFTHTMTVGGYEEQIKRSAETLESDLVYYGIVLFGPWDKVSALTKKFSLWK
jgi:hypothetical protein